MPNSEENDEAGLGHNGGPPLIDIMALTKLSKEELLERLHKGLMVDLLGKLEGGQCSHQEYAVIAKILRDNGMYLAPADPDEQAATAAKKPASLPNFEPGEGDD